MILSRRAFAAAALAALLAPQARALEASEAEAFVRRLIEEATAIVKRDSVAGARVDAFLKLLREKAALEAVARFTMGVNWRAMSEGQRTRFLRGFENYAARVYAARVKDYADQKIEVIGAQDVGKKGVLVKSVLKTPGAEDIAVEWLVDDRTGKPLLVDLIAEGVSLSISQREEFAAMVEKRGGDIDGFLDDLDKLGA